MKTSILIRSIRLPAALFVLLGCLVLSACAGQASASSGAIRIGGAADVLPIANASAEPFRLSNGTSVLIAEPSTSLQDLHSRKIDALLVGRELTPQELEGLQQEAVAYDAVCLLLNTRTYNGGVQQTVRSGAQGNLIVPAAKFAGLKNFSRDDLTSYMRNLLQKYDDTGRWFLSGSYFSFEPFFREGLYVLDEKNPQQVEGAWVWNEIDLEGENLLPGLFDTEKVILQKLDYPLSDLENPDLSFAFRLFSTEEELISGRYSAELPEHLKPEVSPYAFDFFIRIASRRVTLRALEYGFFVSALSIDGVDPLTNPEAVYNGQYLLNRKIYVLTRSDPDRKVSAYVDFLLSREGQQLIADHYYLPLPAGE